MPLLDHFRPPVLNRGSWEGFHGGWPMMLVMDLGKSLPEQYTAEPRVHQLATRSRFESWAYPMVVGEKLPVLPIWLDNEHAISLDLEVSYQQTCRAMRLA